MDNFIIIIIVIVIIFLIILVITAAVVSDDPENKKNEICSSDTDCKSGHYCNSSKLCEEGEGKKLNDDCNVNNDCDLGLICGPENMCIGLGSGTVPLNGQCQISKDCENGLSCQKNICSQGVENLKISSFSNKKIKAKDEDEVDNYLILDDSNNFVWSRSSDNASVFDYDESKGTLMSNNSVLTVNDKGMLVKTKYGGAKFKFIECLSNSDDQLKFIKLLDIYDNSFQMGTFSSAVDLTDMQTLNSTSGNRIAAFINGNDYSLSTINSGIQARIELD